MELRRVLLSIASLLAGCIAAGVRAQAPVERASAADTATPGVFGPRVMAAGQVAWDKIPAEFRDRLRGVIEKPTLQTQGVTEVFNCQPVFYFWLLDHPDVAVQLWRGLGVQCTPIDPHGNGRFAWKDGQGSSVEWLTVWQGPGQRIWFAEGQVKAAPLLPPAAIRAVIFLNYRQGKDEMERPAVRHQVVVYLKTDSRALALAARLLGASAPRLGEKYAGQIQTFYAGLAWYCDEHPKEGQRLLETVKGEK